MSDMKIYTSNRASTGADVFVNGVRLNPYPSQKLREHSPDGFEYGYGGSGPSQLALAILLDALENEQEALTYYQEFKWKFIATAPFDGFVITSLEIDYWYQEQKRGKP